MAHKGWITAGAFSPDGKTIVVASNDNMIRLWDAGTGRPLGSPIGCPCGSAPEFSPDGRTIHIPGDGDAGVLRDAATGRLIGPPKTPGGVAVVLAFSPDGKTMLTRASPPDVTRLLDVRTGESIAPPMVHDDSVGIGLFSPDGKSVLTSDETAAKIARLWDATTGRPIGLPMISKHRGNSFTFSPDGKTIAAGNSVLSVQLWDATTARPIGPPSEPEGSVMLGSADVSFSPDGATVAVRCFFQDKVRLLNAATGLPIGLHLKHQAAVVSVAFSADGKTILTSSQDNTASPALPPRRSSCLAHGPRKPLHRRGSATTEVPF